MTDTPPHDPPSPFVTRWIRTLAGAEPRPRCALDVAMGRGRHARVLAEAGLTVYGVDREFDVIRAAVFDLRQSGLLVQAWCADLSEHPLPPARFDVIVVTRYLQRGLFPSLTAALAPGGTILYETFTVKQRALGRGPTSPDHLLEPGELPAYFADLELLFHEETTEPEALARVAARKPSGL
jgi:tellurite methyltransferase